MAISETLKTSFGFNSDTVWSYILGAGLAIVLFVFMAGWVSYTDVMGGVAASFLSARSALSGGFLNKLMASIESKSEVKALKGIPSGLAAGFALGTLLGFIPNCNSWLWIAGAESFITDWTTDRSGKIHQIVDNAELTDNQTHFSLSYNVKGGRDFRFRYDLSSDIWEGEVKASPGDVITVSFSDVGND